MEKPTFTRPLPTIEAAALLARLGACTKAQAVRGLHLHRAKLTYMQFAKGGKMYFLENELVALAESVKKGGELWLK